MILSCTGCESSMSASIILSAAPTGGVLLGCPLRPRALCVSSGVRGGCAPVESSAGIGFTACAGTKAAFLAYPC